MSIAPEVRNFIKELSDALLKVRPLGGSEMFVHRFGNYYADPNYCGAMIENLTKRLHESRMSEVRTERNRDMWKGQCERQAEELTKLREALAFTPHDGKATP